MGIESKILPQNRLTLILKNELKYFLFKLSVRIVKIAFIRKKILANKKTPK